jgi:hypothetical protein
MYAVPCIQQVTVVHSEVIWLLFEKSLCGPLIELYGWQKLSFFVSWRIHPPEGNRVVCEAGHKTRVSRRWSAKLILMSSLMILWNKDRLNQSVRISRIIWFVCVLAAKYITWANDNTELTEMGMRGGKILKQGFSAEKLALFDQIFNLWI